MIITPKKAYLYAYDNGIIFPTAWYVTPHFKWNEVFVNESKQDGIPIFEVFDNSYKAALQMELIRCKCNNNPITVHSWVRQIPHNKRAESTAKASSHINGMAVDFDVKNMTCEQVRKIILDNKMKVRVEANTSTWVHIDIGNVFDNNYKWGLFYA